MTESVPVIPVPYFLARPAVAAARPGAAVVVIMEGSGISPQLLRVCQRLAREGYLVAAPDLFHHFGGSDPDRTMELAGLLRSRDVLPDIADTIAELRRLGAERIGITGFCLGGRITYEVATSDLDVECAVAFYGAGIADRLGELRCPTLMLYGGNDEYVSGEEIAAVESRHPGDVVVYPDAGHGFFRDGSEGYAESAATDAWHRLTGMFAAHLDPDRV